MDEVAPGTLLESILSLSVHMGEIAGFGSTERRTGYALNRADMPAPQTSGMFAVAADGRGGYSVRHWPAAFDASGE